MHIDVSFIGLLHDHVQYVMIKVGVLNAGQAFTLPNGPYGKQGMLHVVLRDRVSGQSIVSATTHLKAKSGQVICLLPH